MHRLPTTHLDNDVCLDGLAAIDGLHNVVSTAVITEVNIAAEVLS